MIVLLCIVSLNFKNTLHNNTNIIIVQRLVIMTLDENVMGSASNCSYACSGAGEKPSCGTCVDGMIIAYICFDPGPSLNNPTAQCGTSPANTALLLQALL